MRHLQCLAIILLVSFLFISYNSPAQVQLCVDRKATIVHTGAGQGVFDFNNKWTPGTTIRVSFLDGTEWQKSKVRQYAITWCKYANIKFQFVKLGTGDVRVSFDKRGSYSFIGTDAKNILPTSETMNLGWIEKHKTEAELKSVILHEFGHALGLLHEHMNPLSNIQWNKPAVYAWYLQYEGWDKEMVDKQVFDRYSVNMTNKRYDPNSIMHYPIPAGFTLDGYTMKENGELSEMDKKLIAELYPPIRSFPFNNKTSRWSKLQAAAIEYDAVENGKTGLRIRQDFLIYNARGSKCTMAVYFYDADNSKPLEDRNGIKASADGNVAAYINFTPDYDATQYSDLHVFMPYDELELGNGSFRLKCYVAIFDDQLRLITTSGYQYFSFAQGTNSKEVKATVVMNDAKGQLEFTPLFTIHQARGLACTAAVYLYDAKGVPLKDMNQQYTSVDGLVMVSRGFKPTEEVQVYKNDSRELRMEIPYSELHLPKGLHHVRYKIILLDPQGNKIQAGELASIQYRQP